MENPTGITMAVYQLFAHGGGLIEVHGCKFGLGTIFVCFGIDSSTCVLTPLSIINDLIDFNHLVRVG